MINCSERGFGPLPQTKFFMEIQHCHILCSFMSFSTVFQSYPDDGRVIMKVPCIPIHLNTVYLRFFGCG